LENSIRGGISTISHRYAKANNAMIDGHDPSEDSNYLIYIDANNLYGYSMSQPLPISDFRFLTDEEVRQIDFDAVTDDSETGFIREVDLTYPQHLYDAHNDYFSLRKNYPVSKGALSQRSTDTLKITCVGPM
jgi:hypothetical protein